MTQPKSAQNAHNSHKSDKDTRIITKCIHSDWVKCKHNHSAAQSNLTTRQGLRHTTRHITTRTIFVSCIHQPCTHPCTCTIIHCEIYVHTRFTTLVSPHPISPSQLQRTNPLLILGQRDRADTDPGQRGIRGPVARHGGPVSARGGDVAEAVACFRDVRVAREVAAADEEEGEEGGGLGRRASASEYM